MQRLLYIIQDIRQPTRQANFHKQDIVDSLYTKKYQFKQRTKMSIDVHSLMATVNLDKLIQKVDSKNIQVSDLINAMVESEPSLFNNTAADLMPVIEVPYIFIEPK